jgi:hypothetical protein
METALKGVFDAAIAVLATALAASLAAAHPRACEAGGAGMERRPNPFDTDPPPSGAPKAMKLAACRIFARSRAGDVDFVRSDSAAPQSRARARTQKDAPGIFVSVVGADGRALSTEAHIPAVKRLATALWADFNADGREDFVIIALTDEETPAGPACELCFAMSKAEGYSVTVVKSVAPAASDFVRLESGRSAFLQASFVCGQSGEGEGAVFTGYYVFNLLDLSGESPALSSADARFPVWMDAAGGATAELSDDEKALLWMAQPERIFRRRMAGAPAESNGALVARSDRREGQ